MGTDMDVTMLECDGMMRLPDAICKAARLKNGTLLQATITADGILLRTMRPSDDEQTWVRASKRLSKLNAMAANEQAASGNTVFYSDEEFLEALEKAVTDHADV
jgi:antitoxin component of MazEF toxin-antitoxin module